MLVRKDHDQQGSLLTKPSVSYDLCSLNKGPFLGTVKLRESLLTALNNIDTLTLAPPVSPPQSSVTGGRFP